VDEGGHWAAVRCVVRDAVHRSRRDGGAWDCVAKVHMGVEIDGVVCGEYITTVLTIFN
jgi:hypothetical protein